MKVTKSKTLLTVTAFIALSLLAGCSNSSHNQLEQLSVNEHNSLLTDMTQQNYLAKDRCMIHSQSIVTINNFNSDHPQPVYKLTQKEIKCD
ncbi:hypothetical protein [Photobacterium carnosum]|uniref:hypothetical protein n=1 Tax=Photobacterium carnosum TaxID=2023717 RepID=UPI001E6212EA|nr:hypothetical protein [Photobacterium carnosum]MCD9527849.1 hypothetical protein [Photobacterium carnosum]